MNVALGRLGNTTPAQRQAAFAVVGGFIDAAAELDMMMTALLGAFTGIGEIGAHELVLHAIDLNRKLELLKTLGNTAPDRDDFRQVLRLVKFTQGVTTKRNMVAHGILFAQDGEFFIGSLTLPRVLHCDGGRHTLDLKLLPPITERIGIRLAEVVKLVEHFEAHIPLINDKARAITRAQEPRV